MKLEKGQSVRYIGETPYQLANGQEVNKQFEVFTVLSDVHVNPGFFELSYDLDLIHKEALKENAKRDEEAEKEREEKELADKIAAKKAEAAKAKPKQ